MYNKYIKVFISAFSQVFFIAMNTYFVSKENMILAFITAVCISSIWVYNLKTVAHGNFLTSVIYVLGSGTGSVTAIFCAKTLIKFLPL